MYNYDRLGVVVVQPVGTRNANEDVDGTTNFSDCVAITPRSPSLWDSQGWRISTKLTFSESRILRLCKDTKIN